MNLLRFILPFLFVRNWYTGERELSRMRCILFGTLAFFVILGIIIAYVLQMPVTYSASV